MCGILGIVGKGFVQNNNWIKSNLNKISHRGPDDKGIWNSNDQLVCLGHTRLSIIDLSYKNHQPIVDEERKISLIFNGEIYNYMDLKVQLENLGYRFKTNGDTEVLLKSYVHWKEDCFKKIEGMFAFSICDEKRKKVFLVRDQYGQKPLYYKYFNQTLKFGSELKLFLDGNSTAVASASAWSSWSYDATNRYRYVTLASSVTVSANQSYWVMIKNYSGGYSGHPYTVTPYPSPPKTTTSGNIQFTAAGYRYTGRGTNSSSSQSSLAQYPSTILSSTNYLYGNTDLIFLPD